MSLKFNIPSGRRLALPVGSRFVFPSSEVAWTPESLNAAAWYDAADTKTISGSSVTQWNDKSGNGKHLKSTDMPGIATFNLVNALNFNGNVMKTDNGLGVSIRSLFIAFKTNSVITSSSNEQHITSTVQDTVTVGISLGSCTGVFAGEVVTQMDENLPNTYVKRQGVSSANLASLSTAAHVVSTVLSTNWFIGVDGSADLRNLTSGTRNPLLYASSFGVGGQLRRGEENSFYGLLLEIIALDYEATEEERQRIEGYLAWKWGISGSLPEEHPYKLIDPYPYMVSSALPSQANILAAVMTANSYWQTTQLTTLDNDWNAASYFPGAIDVAKALNDATTWAYVEAWGDRYSWGKHVTINDPYNADDQCAFQSYIDYYIHEGRIDPAKYAAMLSNLSAMIADGDVDHWTWCDALFMAMPGLAKIGVEESNSTYFTKLYAYFNYARSTVGGQGLYDETDHLWFRDDYYFYPAMQSANGEKVFWSRGNGWVFGGLARTIAALPDGATGKSDYVAVFQEMSAKLIEIQGSDGFWSANLLDSIDPWRKESSGSSFFVYGLAWGINNGLLDSSTYLPHVAKGWNALMDWCSHPSGSVGWSQNVGLSPYGSAWKAFDQNNFTVGAFLAAGIQCALLKGPIVP